MNLAAMSKRFLRNTKTLKRFLLQSESVLLLVIIAVGFLVSLRSQYFLTTTNMIDVLRAAYPIGIVAIGEALVLMLGEIDLSVAAVIGLAGVVFADLMTHGISPWIAIIGGIAAGGCVGLVNGIVNTYFGVHSFIVTLGTMSVAQGFTLLITGGLPIGLPDSVLFLGQNEYAGIPLPVIVLFVFVLCAQVVLSYVVIGRRVLFTGDNRDAARLAGIPVNQTRVLVFVVAGCLAGVAGILLSCQLATASADAGSDLLLPIIAAAVVGGVSLLGGRGSMMGVFLGAFLLGLVSDAFVILRLSSFWQQATYGIVVVAAGIVDQVRQGRFSQALRRITRTGTGARVASASDVAAEGTTSRSEVERGAMTEEET